MVLQQHHLPGTEAAHLQDTEQLKLHTLTVMIGIIMKVVAVNAIVMSGNLSGRG